jgi:hypothetical protein
MEYKSLEDSMDDWLELESESIYLNPFLTHAWATSCVKHHPHVNKAKVGILTKDNKSIALFPVFKPRNKGDYAGVLIRDGYEKDYDVVEFVDEICKSEGLYPYPVSDGVIDQFFTGSVFYRQFCL